MTAILYPVATNGEQALSAPIARAARAREAEIAVGQAVAFVTEAVGPVFATRDAALDAWPGRVEDDRPGRPGALPAEDRYCRLVEVASQRLPAPAKPVYREGRRWPAPPPPAPTVWRLQVSFWRVVAAEAPIDAPQARQARRGEAVVSGGEMLRAIARQPLRPVAPQQPLDIGLFEARLPENPQIVVPDE
ncbi:MAG: hypothetical protein ACK4YQ_02810 [Phenylobacterium sp.]|uniref:hypothetical protein n=1 Tax=Phenylobacterium sp. TaxID=1871053 RepID=UPI00391C68D1